MEMSQSLKHRSQTSKWHNEDKTLVYRQIHACKSRMHLTQKPVMHISEPRREKNGLRGLSSGKVRTNPVTDPRRGVRGFVRTPLPPPPLRF